MQIAHQEDTAKTRPEPRNKTPSAKRETSQPQQIHQIM